MGNNTKRFLIFIAVLSLLFVLGDIFLWINITNQYSNPDTLKQAYLEKYPSSIQNIQGLTIVPLLLLIFASLIFLRSAKSNFVKMASATILAVLAIVIIWKMFTLQ